MHVLVTSRLTLRPPTYLDAEDIALWLSNRNVARMLGPVPSPYRIDDALKWISDLASKPEGLVYTIHRERLIGVVSLEGGGPVPRLGYWLGDPWHGRGFMSEAARALLQYGFTAKRFEAVTSSVFADNPVSLRMQEKLGFVVTAPGEIWSQARNAKVVSWKTSLSASAFAALSHAPSSAAA